MDSWIHPAAILILGSVFIPFFKGRVKKVYLLLIPALAFLSVLNMSEGTYGVYHLLGQEITFGRVDKLSLAFAFIFTLMAFIGMCYGLHVKEDGHHIAGLLYAGSATGVAFAGDFLTLLVFWEFLAFSSVFLILYRRTQAAYNAAFRYILVHAFSGVCLMGGIFLVYTQTNSLAFNPVDAGEKRDREGSGSQCYHAVLRHHYGPGAWVDRELGSGYQVAILVYQTQGHVRCPCASHRQKGDQQEGHC